MPDFLKAPESLYIILFLVVPGLVIVYVRSRFISGRTPSHTENVLGYLVLSLLYYSIILPFIEQAFNVREPWVARAAGWIVLTLVGPALFGLLPGSRTRLGSRRFMSLQQRGIGDSQRCRVAECL
jgi:Family of unknown function (DUF6338)